MTIGYARVLTAGQKLDGGATISGKPYGIERLSQSGAPLIRAGKTTNTVYSLSPKFRGQMDLLQEATRIGLNHLLKNHENLNIEGENTSDGTLDLNLKALYSKII